MSQSSPSRPEAAFPGDASSRLRRRRARGLSATAALAAAALLLAACGGGSSGSSGNAIPNTWSGVESQAKKEKTVVFYTLSDTLAASLKTAFEKTYPGMTVKTVIGSPGDLASRVVTEARSGASTADVIMLPGGQRKTLLDSGAVRAFTVPSDASMTKQYQDPQHYAHPVYITPINLIYNTDKLSASEVPTNLYDLADPKWKGKIAFDSPANAGTAATWLAGMRKTWGDDKWKAWLQGLKNNDVFITEDATSAYQAVLRGEAEIGVDNPGDVLGQASGTPVANAYYDDTIPFVQYVWLAKNASHPSAGELFVNWLTSKAGQTVMATTGRSPSLTSLDVPNSLSNLIPQGTTMLPAGDLQDWYDNAADYVDTYNKYWPSN
ncbi:MAG: extracellular solute-binding protein [Nocardioides sp.]